MKRLLTLSLVSPLLLLSVSPVFAQVPPMTTQLMSPSTPVQRILTIPQQRAAYRQQLATIKDTRKKAVVEKLDTQMQQVNNRLTTSMTQNLDELSLILEKVATQASAMADDTSLQLAREAITATKQAVASQAAKQYVFTITDELTLNQAVKTTLATLKTDLQDTHSQLLETRTAVITAIRAIKQTQSTSVSDTMEGVAQ